MPAWAASNLGQWLDLTNTDDVISVDAPLTEANTGEKPREKPGQRQGRAPFGSRRQLRRRVGDYQRRLV